MEEFGGKVNGVKVELVSGDHQNKADVGATIARTWMDRDGVDAIADFSNSSVGLAVQALATERKKITLVTAASTQFTGKSCTPYSSQWVYNSYSNGHGLAKLLTERGADTWFLVTVDYAFGHAFAADIRKTVMAAGGKVVGEVRHPLNASDMSSFLLQAQASKAKVVAFASAGGDLTTAIKQAGEFGLTRNQLLAAPSVFVNDVHSLGLKTSQGLQFLTAFYWDRDDNSRAWARKFFERRKAMPTMTQAGVYSSVRHFLKAVEAAGSDDGDRVAKKMKELPIRDAYTANGRVREDGQVMHDMYLVEVKKPADSKGPWDYYKVLATDPADQVFQPLATSECALVRK
ncbi:ABC transporter substrate-binding protein [Ramlibacter henchirensis]|uniref:ABC transporter substrate-binding protein n=1 Tax=Ramlibacter henchirensis TaxID=204072 RepID=A0A4Z0C439_9BURK|nr:ABC transporter substrate-binding protein [Ramlibacter henchirensis]TFZ05722.1 ABC transporter substrate-binding protein [Ramlibacter henchirensis]